MHIQWRESYQEATVKTFISRFTYKAQYRSAFLKLELKIGCNHTIILCFTTFGITQLDPLKIPLQKQNHMCKLNTKIFIVQFKKKKKSFKKLKLRANYALVCMNVFNNSDKILTSIIATSMLSF